VFEWVNGNFRADGHWNPNANTAVTMTLDFSY